MATMPGPDPSGWMQSIKELYGDSYIKKGDSVEVKRQKLARQKQIHQGSEYKDLASQKSKFIGVPETPEFLARMRARNQPDVGITAGGPARYGAGAAQDYANQWMQMNGGEGAPQTPQAPSLPAQPSDYRAAASQQMQRYNPYSGGVSAPRQAPQSGYAGSYSLGKPRSSRGY